jgi:hypothetical protein
MEDLDRDREQKVEDDERELESSVCGTCENRPSASGWVEISPEKALSFGSKTLSDRNQWMDRFWHPPWVVWEARSFRQIS